MGAVVFHLYHAVVCLKNIDCFYLEPMTVRVIDLQTKVVEGNVSSLPFHMVPQSSLFRGELYD